MVQKIDGIQVKFPYLSSHGRAVLWVGHAAPQGMSIIPSNDNLEFHEITPWDEPETEFPTFFVMVVGAFALIAGIVLNEVLNRNFLKKAGYDHNEILKAYLEKKAEKVNDADS
jgi:hypothetical protein